MSTVTEWVNTLLQQAAVLIKQRRFDEAKAYLEEALQLEPDNAETHNYLGNIFVYQERYDEAIAAYRHALQLNPHHFGAHYILAIALQDKGRYEESEAHLRHALAVNPNHADAHNRLGLVLQELAQFDEAVASYRQAVLLNPALVDAHVNLGSALQGLDRLDEAIISYQSALRLNASCAEAWQNMGSARRHQGYFDDALACIEQSLRIKPDYPLAHLNRAEILLLQGDYDEGWAEFESRWEHSSFGRRQFNVPQWDGLPLNGRTILVYAEQGLGDTLQFLRYVPLVLKLGGRIILQCQAPLLRLLANYPGVDRLEVVGFTNTAIDCHAPLVSLAGIFRTTCASIPANVPYLQADAELVEHWRKRLERVAGFKIGIAWQGNPSYRQDRHRSIPLTAFSPLTRVEGVQLISLQKGPGTEQLAALLDQFPLLDLGSELDETSGPFMDAAAIMKNLDLVITSDTAIPHLAGALGVPVWLAVPRVPDWRWLLQREDSPWYPTMRLFRQGNANEWSDVFQRITSELKEKSKK